MRPPPEELKLADGTYLALHRGVSITMEDNEKMVGDWLIALEPGRPRAVALILHENTKPTAKMIYDTHTLEHRLSPETPPVDEKLKYVFYKIDDKEEEGRYLGYWEMFQNS